MGILKPPTVSIVIPVYNEIDVLPLLYKRLADVLTAVEEDCEIVFIDDGSSDGSLPFLTDLSNTDHRVNILSFSRNFGHQAAFAAGLQYARGLAVILMDADLQDPPELIPNFIQEWKKGYPVVYGIRCNRQEGYFKKMLYSLHYRLLKAVSSVDMPTDSGDFSLIDRKIVDVLNQLPERKRYIRGLRSWVGFQQKGIEYDREARTKGETKYTLRKLVRLSLAGLLGFSNLPLRVSSFLGLLLSVIGFITICFLISLKVFFGIDLQGWTSLMVMIIFMGGVQLLMIGILGEYLSYVYEEMMKRPIHIVSKKIGAGFKE